MKINAETIIGVMVFLTAIIIITVVTDMYGILYLGFAFIVAVISINLFSRKSILAKTGAVILNMDLLYKIFMPRKYRKAIKELDENKSHKKHNKFIQLTVKRFTIFAVAKSRASFTCR